VGLTACHGRLIARPPASLAGLAERRGRGIEAAEHENAAVVRLVVDLVAAAEAERMPAPAALETEILGVSLPRQPVACGAAEAAGLVLAALAAAVAARAADQSATAPAPLFRLRERRA
jgi:HPr kinase/phosphorylase